MLKYIAILALLITLAPSAEAKVIDEHIYLVPAGSVDKKVLDAIKEMLPKSLPMSVSIEIAPQKKIPESAYDPSRHQYNAKVLFDDISERVNLVTSTEVALVIVDVDLYSPESDFVFGISDASKATCIISLTRLRNEFYGRKPDNKLFLGRVIKETAQELGRARGLSYCPDQKCVMYFSKDLSDTDRKKSSFCHECRNKLHTRYITPLIKGPLLNGRRESTLRTRSA